MSSLVYQFNCPLFHFIFWYCWSNKKDGSVTVIKDFNKTRKLPFSTGPCTNVPISLEEKNHLLLFRLSLIVERSRWTKKEKEGLPGIKTTQGTSHLNMGPIYLGSFQGLRNLLQWPWVAGPLPYHTAYIFHPAAACEPSDDAQSSARKWGEMNMF